MVDIWKKTQAYLVKISTSNSKIPTEYSLNWAQHIRLCFCQTLLFVKNKNLHGLMKLVATYGPAHRNSLSWQQLTAAMQSAATRSEQKSNFRLLCHTCKLPVDLCSPSVNEDLFINFPRFHQNSRQQNPCCIGSTDCSAPIDKKKWSRHQLSALEWK